MHQALVKPEQKQIKVSHIMDMYLGMKCTWTIISTINMSRIGSLWETRVVGVMWLKWMAWCWATWAGCHIHHCSPLIAQDCLNRNLRFNRIFSKHWWFSNFSQVCAVERAWPISTVVGSINTASTASLWQALTSWWRNMVVASFQLWNESSHDKHVVFISGSHPQFFGNFTNVWQSMLSLSSR